MKKLFFIIATIVFTLSFSSCGEDWLETYPEVQLSDEEAILTVADARIAINGAYDLMRDYRFYGRELWASEDSGTDDVVLRTDNSARFTTTYMWTFRPGDQFFSPIWDQGYLILLAANQIIMRLPNIEPATEAEKIEKEQILGEAYFVRALVHFELVKVFAQAYNFTSDASHRGVPYMLEPSTENNVPRNTVKEVFEYLIEDLKTAISTMNIDQPAVPYSAGKLAAKAILARVYLYKAATSGVADFTEAAKLAEEVINSKKYIVATPEQYRVSATGNAFISEMWLPDAGYSSESIFTLPYSPTERQYTDALSKIYLDKEKGYADLLPSDDIRALIGSDENDVRNSLFYVSSDGKQSLRKFFGPTDNWDLANLNIIRISEMYLIAAEGYVKGSAKDEVRALRYLNEIKTNRGLAAISTTGADLVSEILLERRKELAFEGGRKSDLKRLNFPVVRGVDSQNPANQDFGVSYPDYRFAAPISEDEMNANKEMVQNDGYN